MIRLAQHPIHRLLRNGICAAVMLNAVLTAAGVLISPASAAGRDGLLSLLGPVVSLTLYVAAALRLTRPGEYDPRPLRIAAGFGLAAGAVYASEILLEYSILPGTDLNIRLGWIEYGSVLVLYCLAGLRASIRAGQLRPGLSAAFWSSIVASVIWLAVLLLATEVFWGTPRQHQVFLAEGDYEDFARSGMRDFNAFTMQDLRGASFFHLLLGPASALLAGAVGGLAGKCIHGWRAGEKSEDLL